MHSRTLFSLLGSLALGASASAQCDPLTLHLEKDVYQPFENAELTVSGPAGSPSILLIDLVPGPVDVPGLGGVLDLGLSKNLALVKLPPIPGHGELVVSCDIECGDPIIGVPLYLQVIGLDLDSMWFCPSNSEVLLFRDDYGACEVEGCTPGYWKNHEETWGPTDLEPGDNWCEIFGADVSELDFTLLDALRMEESDLLIQTLGSHSVAALLNSLHPDSNYPLAPQAIIDLVREAALSGDKDEQEEAKDLLADLNETNCPF